MGLLNEKLLEKSDFVQEVYTMQVKAFSPVEYPYISGIVEKYGIRTVLDIGAGEGTFILGLAKLVPGVSFTAVEADPKLFAKAKRKKAPGNVTFINTMFGNDFPKEKYDMILARFALEHMKNIRQFVKEAKQRLEPGGLILVTEYYCEFLKEDNPRWKLFRKKEIELYREIGSDPMTPLVIPKRLKEAGFREVSSIFRHFTPTTIGREEFYKLIISYTRAYSQIAPKVFTKRVTDEVLQYCINGIPENPGCEDRLFVAHIIGIKK